MEISHFKDYFESFLKDNHPELIIKLNGDLNEFVDQHVSEAEELLESLTRDSVHTDAALESCYDLLKSGLKFSRYNYIDSLLKENFPEKVTSFTETGHYKHLVISLIYLCEKTFDSYAVDDNFSYNDSLNNELLTIITKRM